jgi:FkbM family methyltransferase
MRARSGIPSRRLCVLRITGIPRVASASSSWKTATPLTEPQSGSVNHVRAKQLVRNTLGDRRVRRLKSLRTRASSSLDVGPWRRPGLNNLDVLLAEAIGRPRGGTFIELGGNDGLQASNSFLLERELGWRGVLIEAIPELAAEARRNRPEAIVVCAAASSSPRCAIIGMAYEDLTSKVLAGANDVMVATTTLSTVVDHVLRGTAPDLLSIDVEGHELEVIAGLDLDEHRPNWILVETDRLEAVSRALDCYKCMAQLSYHDYLFELGGV